MSATKGAREGISRRDVLRGATAVGGLGMMGLGVGACSGGEETAEPASVSGQSLVPTASVPVGGGVVLPDAKVVVVQPTAGEFKAFTAVCTHAGCTVGDVGGGTVNCPCHGSKFGIEDGAPQAGPAQRPLAAIAVRVDGTTVVRA